MNREINVQDHNKARLRIKEIYEEAYKCGKNKELLAILNDKIMQIKAFARLSAEHRQDSYFLFRLGFQMY